MAARRRLLIGGGVLAVGLALLGASFATGHSSGHPTAAPQTGVSPTITTQRVPTQVPITRREAGSVLKPQPGVTAQQTTTTVPPSPPATAPPAPIRVAAES